MINELILLKQDKAQLLEKLETLRRDFNGALAYHKNGINMEAKLNITKADIESTLINLAKIESTLIQYQK
jgi:hypothetical protein